ncbi:MAG: hypothetical protein PHR29_05910 [Acholeplasmataceae bacterium]|nr:hypothetical protein [Acholeplasmataceae bacterium]
MVKIVINTGSGFDLTHKAIMRYAELKGIKLTPYLFNFETQLFVRYNPDNEDERELEGALHYFINIDYSILPEQNLYCRFYQHIIDRTDPALIQVVNELKDSEHLDLKIVEVPDGVKWEIEEDEMGPECVREISRCWS